MLPPIRHLSVIFESAFHPPNLPHPLLKDFRFSLNKSSGISSNRVRQRPSQNPNRPSPLPSPRQLLRPLEARHSSNLTSYSLAHHGSSSTSNEVSSPSLSLSSSFSFSRRLSPSSPLPLPPPSLQLRTRRRRTLQVRSTHRDKLSLHRGTSIASSCLFLHFSSTWSELPPPSRS